MNILFWTTKWVFLMARSMVPTVLVEGIEGQGNLSLQKHVVG